MMRTTFCVAAFAIAGCGGHTPPPAAPEQSVDQKKAETDARGLVAEIYRTLGRTNTDGLMTLAAEPLVVFGPRRGDAMASRTDALVALKQLVDPKKRVAVRSGGLVASASPGGHSAWVVDVIAVQGAPMAMTAVLSNTDDLWLVTAVTLAATPSIGSLRASLKKDAVVPPAMAAAATVDPAAAGAVERFTLGLADPKLWGADLAARDGAIAVGPAGEVSRGKAQLEKAWKKRIKGHVRAAQAGEITAGATADHQLAWVSAPLVRFADGEDPIPLRVFAVFEPAGNTWRLVALHEAVAIEEPGSGTAYKKVEAPAIQVDKPPAKQPTKPTKPVKPKKK